MSGTDKDFLTHLREQHDHWKAQSAGLQIKIEVIEAERDRYKEALEKIVAGLSCNLPETIAKQALEGK